MPKTLEQLKTRERPPSIKDAIAWLEKNVKGQAPYYEEAELASRIGVTDAALQHHRLRLAELKPYWAMVRSGAGGHGRIYWSLPRYIKLIAGQDAKVD